MSDPSGRDQPGWGGGQPPPPPPSQPPTSGPAPAQAEPPPKKEKRSPGCMKIGLGVAGGIILVIILIVVLFAVAFNSASKNVQKERNAHAITQAQFDALQLGQPKDVVLRGLPQPQDSQQFSSDYGSDLPQLNTSCVYFNEHTTGDTLVSTRYFQLCFDENNILRSKNAY